MRGGNDKFVGGKVPLTAYEVQGDIPLMKGVVVNLNLFYVIQIGMVGLYLQGPVLVVIVQDGPLRSARVPRNSFITG